eukprot:6701384-Karenia_brevis.AAC.1
MLLLPVKSFLWKWFAAKPKAFQDNFSMPLFKERYASNTCVGGNQFLHCRDVEEDNFEWQRYLLLPFLNDPIRFLCCPEDVDQTSKCKHSKQTIC